MTANQPGDLAGEHTYRERLARNAEAALNELAQSTVGAPVPAPHIYRLLGEIRASLAHVEEVARALPDGLRRSLQLTTIQIYDRDPVTGHPREPARQVEIASQQLLTVARHVEAAWDALDTAQAALREQGYNARSSE